MNRNIFSKFNGHLSDKEVFDFVVSNISTEQEEFDNTIWIDVYFKGRLNGVENLYFLEDNIVDLVLIVKEYFPICGSYINYEVTSELRDENDYGKIIGINSIGIYFTKRTEADSRVINNLFSKVNIK